MSKNYPLLLILAIAILIFVSSCQSSPTPEAQPPASPAAKPTASPTAIPIASPTVIPTASPTAIPTESVMESEVPYPPPPFDPAVMFNPYPGPSGEVTDWTKWEQALVVIKSGDVVEVYQVETLHVTLVLGDGRLVLTKEPEIGEVFRIIEECGDACKDIVDKSE